MIRIRWIRQKISGIIAFLTVIIMVNLFNVQWAGEEGFCMLLLMLYGTTLLLSKKRLFYKDTIITFDLRMFLISLLEEDRA